jgi:hypothetical protein
MRLIGLIVGGTLAVAVIAEGAYIVHTRRQVERLSSRLEALGTEASDLLAGSDGGRYAGRAMLQDEGDLGEPRRAGGRALPPPRLVTPPPPAAGQAPPSNDPLPLPPAIDTPDGREQLRRFVVAALEQEREQGRQRQEQRQEEREQARRQRMATELGLSPTESEKFNQIMAQTQTARVNLRSRIESGELNREAIGREMATMREEADKQMRSLLGDDRMKKLEGMRGRGGPGPMQGDRRGGMWGNAQNRGGERPEGAPPGAAPAP